jgi:hypothetical protein
MVVDYHAECEKDYENTKKGINSLSVIVPFRTRNGNKDTCIWYSDFGNSDIN